LQDGLYKVEFHTVHGTGSGVIYASSGRLRGGNSAFAFIGHYTGAGDAIQVKVSTERHNDDPAFKPLFGVDRVTLTRERQHGRFRRPRAADAGRRLHRDPDPDQRLA
jgi:T3SS negative regulator,GrlR